MNQDMVKDLIAVQGEIKNPPNTATNPFHHNKYAPLSDILNMVRPLLTKHGFVLLQNTGSEPDTNRVYVQTILLHDSGEEFKSDKLLLTAKAITKKKSKSSRNMEGDELNPEPISNDIDPQRAGSAITYGRRYQLSALLGIASEDDDDANSVSSVESKDKKPSEKPKPKRKPRPKRTKEKLDKPQIVDMSVDWDEVKSKNALIKKYYEELEAEGKEITKKAICEKAQGNGLSKAELGAIRKLLGIK